MSVNTNNAVRLNGPHRVSTTPALTGVSAWKARAVELNARTGSFVPKPVLNIVGTVTRKDGTIIPFNLNTAVHPVTLSTGPTN